MSSHSAYHANLRRGRLLRETGRLKEACDYLSAAIQANPEAPEAYLELALAQSEMPGRKAESIRTIDRALALQPESDEYLGFKAYLLAQFGRNKEALDYAERALHLFPLCHIALVARANVYTRTGEYTKAEETARLLLEFDAEDTNALNLLAQSLRFQHRFREAQEVLGQILARVPEDAFGQANAGYEALHAGDHRRANEHFLTALRLEPKSEHARRGLIESLRSRVWIYRTNLKIMDLLQGGKNYGSGFRTTLIVLTVVTGGLFFIVILAYLFAALTIRPISDFFLLLEPLGRRALTIYERRSALFAGAVGTFFLVLIAISGSPRLVMVFGVYLALFALCVYIPQWGDALRARREAKLLADTDAAL